MTNEPSWLRTYIGDLAREAGLTEPTNAEMDACLYGVGFEFEGKRIDPAEVYLAVDPTKPRIDEMTLADYRRGIANMKTRYV